MIRLLAFGGTIASTPRPGSTEVAPGLTGDQLVESLPQLAAVAAIDVRDFPPLPSFEVTPAHMLDVARATVRAFDDGAEGVVITHGTDTIEETAYALALLLPRGRPLVLTGAMRNPTLPGADGPANLLAAARVAVSSLAAGLGPLVVMNDELHAARFATKAHTQRVSTFASPGAGPLGDVSEGQVNVWWRPAWEDHLGLPATLDGLEVELVRIAAGVGDTLLRAAVERRPTGIVVEGTGGGHVMARQLPALDAAIAVGIPVVIASRSAGGANLERTYRMPGAETDLIDRGAIPAGLLTGHKARLRLLIGRSLGRPARELFPVR